MKEFESIWSDTKRIKRYEQCEGKSGGKVSNNGEKSGGKKNREK